MQIFYIVVQTWFRHTNRSTGSHLLSKK